MELAWLHQTHVDGTTVFFFFFFGHVCADQLIIACITIIIYLHIVLCVNYNLAIIIAIIIVIRNCACDIIIEHACSCVNNRRL